MQDIAARNQKWYNAALTVRDYARSTELQLPEVVIFERLGQEFKGKRILDIGVGGGRTTDHLLKISADYIGIDCSSRMIDLCKARYPSVSFAVCDARDLSRFDTASFDLVLFSFNGLDAVTHTDRLKVLTEIRRVLAPGGVFIFSSHSYRSNIRSPWHLRRLPYHINPFTNPFDFFLGIAAYLMGIFNHSINIRYEHKEKEYCIFNTQGENYGVLSYYIKLKHQVSQLIEMGFNDIRAVGLDGRWIEEAEYSKIHTDAWLYYICRH